MVFVAARVPNRIGACCDGRRPGAGCGGNGEIFERDPFFQKGERERFLRVRGERTRE